MKKKIKKVKKNLFFDKETISRLNQEQLDQVAGGYEDTPVSSCAAFTCMYGCQGIQEEDKNANQQP